MNKEKETKLDWNTAQWKRQWKETVDGPEDARERGLIKLLNEWSVAIQSREWVNARENALIEDAILWDLTHGQESLILKWVQSESFVEKGDWINQWIRKVWQNFLKFSKDEAALNLVQWVLEKENQRLLSSWMKLVVVEERFDLLKALWKHPLFHGNSLRNKAGWGIMMEMTLIDRMIDAVDSRQDLNAWLWDSRWSPETMAAKDYAKKHPSVMDFFEQRDRVIQEHELLMNELNQDFSKVKESVSYKITRKL